MQRIDDARRRPTKLTRSGEYFLDSSFRRCTFFAARAVRRCQVSLRQSFRHGGARSRPPSFKLRLFTFGIATLIDQRRLTMAPRSTKAYIAHCEKRVADSLDIDTISEMKNAVIDASFARATTFWRLLDIQSPPPQRHFTPIYMYRL